MPLLRTALFSSLLVLALSPMVTAATNPGSQHLTNLVGIWTCHYQGSEGTNTVVSTGSRLNENWVQLKSPTGVVLVTYDIKRKMWVQFGTSQDGEYLATANAAPSANSLTWRSVFPPDAPKGSVVISWPSASKRIIDSNYMENGSKMLCG